MTSNRFELVDAPPEDATTLMLRQDVEKNNGAVFCTASAAGSQLRRAVAIDEMPPKDAIHSAVRFAKELAVALVVIDPDGL